MVTPIPALEHHLHGIAAASRFLEAHGLAGHNGRGGEQWPIGSREAMMDDGEA
ncbi:MAG TPA: hypothetical protein VGN42_08030 [Pirellulales bacterium]|nr:hypothetical protein [Pirellulales bacterium]